MQCFPEGGSITEFVEAHLLLNEPCLFGEYATRGWGARINWVKQDGTPNFDYLAKEFGGAQVCVANCSEWMHSAHTTSDMIMADYINYWRNKEDLASRKATEDVPPSSTDIEAQAVEGVTPSNTDVEARAVEGVTPSSADIEARAVEGVTPSSTDIEARAVEGVTPGSTDIEARAVGGVTPSNTDIEARAIEGVTPSSTARAIEGVTPSSTDIEARAIEGVTPSSTDIEARAVEGVTPSSTDALLYLKDWHFFKQYPERHTLTYQLPPFFSSDWLNEVCEWREDVDDDYKFVYMGPAGTWTPFHADVFRSYSWSANICGVKEWLLYRPGQEDMLRDKWGHLPSDVTCPSLQDSERYPQSSHAPAPLKVVQRPGEIIFVPSGWFHQVRNLTMVISINHNWANSLCLRRMLDHLRAELALVQAELADCRDMDNWEEHCQVVLRACAGMDLWELAQFCVVVAIPRLHHLQQLMHFDPGECSLFEKGSCCTVLREFIASVISCRGQLNFFTAGVLPPALSKLLPETCRPASVATSCTRLGQTSPEACLAKPDLEHLNTSLGHEGEDTRLTALTDLTADHLTGQYTARQSSAGELQQLLAALPPDLQECVLGRATGSNKHNQQLLTFRAFEVHTLCGVVADLTPSLVQLMHTHSHPHTE